MLRFVLAGLGAILAVAFGFLIADNWEKAQKELKGRKIAVLGPRLSGKTTLITFLLKGNVPEEYIATAKPEKFSGKTVKLDELELKIEDTWDLPGDSQSHHDWERLYKEADFVFYLVDAEKIRSADEEYERTVKGEMRHIGEWSNDRKAHPPRFFLVATHCDLITEYVTLPNTRKTEFTDVFWKVPVMQTLINFGNGYKNVKCVAGSLQSSDERERLVGDILRQAIA